MDKIISLYSQALHFKVEFRHIPNKSASSKCTKSSDRIWKEYRTLVTGDLNSKRVVIVDDVFTSGATILSAVDAIIDSGGTSVLITTQGKGRFSKQIWP